MADVELSIKIPEEYYKSIKDDAKKFLSKGMKVPSLYEIVIKGTPLPKGHISSTSKDEQTTLNDALDNIRAEIADLDDADYDYEGYYKAVTDALQIIDKYKTESLDARSRKNDDLER